MNKIKQLDPSEVLKIAAGEVVERPASVIKELLENSLDAGATNINIKIERAGKILILITDDGCGMTAEDAANATLMHWTSKIKTVDDLNSLQTFGFRGEALASINAVSQMSITTRSRESLDNIATKLDFNFGQLVKTEASNATFGTTIAIQNLFENVPARKKFLKQDETEFNQIFNLVQQFALKNSTIHFTLHKDQKMFLNAPATTDLKNRVRQLWDYSMGDSLIELKHQSEGLSISGLISDSTVTRFSKAGILIFVNNRPVKDQKISRAILAGYQGRLDSGRFPVAFLFLSIDPTKIDVNIHPRKEEVRFENYGKICSAVQTSVNNALSKKIIQSIQVNPITRQDFNNYQKPEPQEILNFDFDLKSSNNQSVDIFEFANFPVSEKTCEAEINFAPKSTSTSELENTTSTQQTFTYEKPFLPEKSIDFGQIIGQLMATFILIEQGDALVIVDQHAAHERILYERFKKDRQAIEGTKLLFPELISLQREELELILQQKTIFSHFGIEVDKFSAVQLVLRSSPCGMLGSDAATIIKDMLENFLHQENLTAEELQNKLAKFLHAQIACKAAVKAGNSMPLQAIQQLLKDLETTPNNFECIHGRPTIWQIDKKTLYKNFDRPCK